ncbi:S-layer homology domain-containing protein [Peptoniphilus indolicus]|uniref:Hexagonal wall protein n=1 Tax=Peptoniphilus indolicus TaxID=33030 RepID=A0A379DAR4_9FIRM|nr:S-layer homology domain-containing protein [Peptoniphilus indolicus]SUB75044.1 Hexagonal wall protein [Peptoniphilus indolicus]
MKEKILSAGLAALLLVGSINPVAYAQNGLSNKAKVEKLVNRKIVEGDEKGNLNLNDNIKRSEITKIIVYALGKEAEAKKLQPKQGKFSDVSISHWANGVISYASEEKMKNGQNIVNGYPDGTFKPEDNITNAELLKMLVVATKKDLNSTEIKNAQWPKDYIKWAEEEKLIGKDTGIEKIEPSEKATRETAFVALSNGLEKIEKKTNTSTNKEEPKKTENKNRSGFNYRTINIVGYDTPRDSRSSNTDSRPAKPLNPTTPTTPKNPAAPLVPSPKEDVKYADGTWYGIAKENYANPQRGEDLVAVTIKDGKITGAKIVYTTEDPATGLSETNGIKILGAYFGESEETFKTPKNIDEKGLKEVQEYLQKKVRGKIKNLNSKYDAVTNATISARAYLLGVEHALERAAKYAKDKEDQKIAFIKVEDRTNAMNEGKLFYDKPINLGFLRFEVTKANGEVLKSQTLDDLKKLGVECNYKNGDVIANQGKRTAIELKFTHAPSLTEQSLNIVVSETPKVKDNPSHFLITYKDGSNQKIDIPKGKLTVGKVISIDKPIEKVELYKDSEMILETEPIYQGDSAKYFAETKNLASKDRWEYGTYRLDTHFEKGLEVESFEIEPITKNTE